MLPSWSSRPPKSDACRLVFLRWTTYSYAGLQWSMCSRYSLYHPDEVTTEHVSVNTHSVRAEYRRA